MKDDQQRTSMSGGDFVVVILSNGQQMVEVLREAEAIAATMLFEQGQSRKPKRSESTFVLVVGETTRMVLQ